MDRQAEQAKRSLFSGGTRALEFTAEQTFVNAVKLALTLSRRGPVKFVGASVDGEGKRYAAVLSETTYHKLRPLLESNSIDHVVVPANSIVDLLEAQRELRNKDWVAINITRRIT